MGREPYQGLAIWENIQRRRQVSGFLRKSEEFLAARYDEDRGIYRAQRRAAVNRFIGGVGTIVRDTGLQTVYRSVSGINADLFDNFFLDRDLNDLHGLPGGQHPALDVAEQAVGMYERDKVWALLRTVWPPFWIERGIRALAECLGLKVSDRVISIVSLLSSVASGLTIWQWVFE